MKNSEHDFTLPPFPGFPSASRYVPLGPVSETVSRVARSIVAREAISLIIGPPGTGKSLACALLAKQFSQTHDVVALGETATTDETSFYRFLLHRLGVAFENTKRGDLELLVHQRLTGADSAGAVIIIDEAASLSIEVLEAIRRLTNTMRDDQPMVSAVVVGGVKLDETLTSPSLESFVQRVTARCYLHPLNAEETRQYIRSSIEACDASPDDTISDTAISAIYHATSGVTRLINQLMTESIDCAAELGESLIDDYTVDQAWASLQQLPGPMTEEPTMKHESSVVEFGELSEMMPMEDELPAAKEFTSELVAESIHRAEEEADAGVVEEAVAGIVELSEPIEEFQPEPAADPIALFGDFENEEHIDVRGASGTSMPQEPAEVDLESMLHSEIVSLSHFAADNTSIRQIESGDQAVANPIESRDEMSFVKETESLEAAEEFPSVIWYDEPALQSDEQPAESEPHQDDTDLLWITEDIDVDRRAGSPSAATPHRVDQASGNEGLKLNVDYRELLEKMRRQTQ